MTNVVYETEKLGAFEICDHLVTFVEYNLEVKDIVKRLLNFSVVNFEHKIQFTVKL